MIHYTVMKGDSLWKISQTYNISLDALLAANPQISDPNFILTGTVINIPEMWTPCGPGQHGGNDCRNIPDCGCDMQRPCIYTAEAGETLESIACKFMIPITRIIYYNLRYGKREPLKAGTKIVIPEDCPADDSLPPNYSRQRFSR